MWNGMKSVVQFQPMESQEQFTNKFEGWLKDNDRLKSSVGDKAVPTPAQTRAYLRKMEGK